MYRAGLAAAVLLTAAFAACGGDDEEGTRANGTETAETQTETARAKGPVVERVTIVETEYELDPSRPEISEPGVVEFVARNEGEIVHALEVEGPKGEAETETFGAGQSRRLRVDLSEPGTYTMYCPVANHRELGMTGEVVVAGGGGQGEGGGGQTEEESGGGSDGAGGY